MSFLHPWLRRDFPKNTEFIMRIYYIIDHLEKIDRKKILSNNPQGDSWQMKKEAKIIMDIENGKRPLSFPPVRLVLHNKRHLFRVEDGISKIRAFKAIPISKIKVSLRVGSW